MDNMTHHVVEEALGEIATEQNGTEEDFKESMERQMQVVKNQMTTMVNAIETLQAKAMKYGQLDEYIEKKRIDTEKMAEYLLQRERGWKY